MSQTSLGQGMLPLSLLEQIVLFWGRINASTDLPLKHPRNKLYKELVLQHLDLQLFDDSRRVPQELCLQELDVQK